METKHGLLLDGRSSRILIDCLDYQANQIKQKVKVEGENPRHFAGLLGEMGSLRGQLVEIHNSANGAERGNVVVVEGKLDES